MVKWLVVLSVIMLALHQGAMVSRFVLHHSRWYGFIDFFDIDVETSLSQWVQSLTLLACAVLLSMVTVGARTHRFGWTAMAVIFVYLSIDEGSRLHENLIPLLHAAFHPSGIFLFAWVIPGGILVALFAAVYTRFLRDLDRTTRVRFIFAGALYVAGALGMELVGGWWATDHGFNNMIYQMVLVPLEETLEVAGQVLFLYALLCHLESTTPSIGLRVGAAREGDEEPGEPARTRVWSAGRPDA